MSDLLREVFSAEWLRELCDPRTLARGAAYFRDGRVELGTVGPDGVEAIVRGTMPYRVTLRAAGGRPAWWCDCPVGAEGRWPLPVEMCATVGCSGSRWRGRPILCARVAAPAGVAS